MLLSKFSISRLYTLQPIDKLRKIAANQSTFRFYASHTYKQDPYQILGVNPNAPREQIKKQYYKLCQKYHPDVNSSEEDKNKMAEINAAWEMIKDGTADRILQMQREHQQYTSAQGAQQYGGYTRDPSMDERYRYYNRSNYYETNAKKKNVVYMEERIFQAPTGTGQVRVVIYRYDDGSTDQQIFYESRRDDSSKFTSNGYTTSQSGMNMPPRPNPINTMKIIARTLQIGLMLYFAFLMLSVFLSMFVPREVSQQQQQQQQKYR